MTRVRTWMAAGAAMVVLAMLGRAPSVDEARAEELKPLEIGAPSPEWSGLVGVDGEKHALKDYKDAKAIVVVFLCNHCPVAVAYEDRLVALQKDYKDKGVQVIALSVSNMPQDALEPMKKRAKEKGFNFPYLHDASQNVGRDYGAEVTPDIFVLDGKRKLAYRGGIDDSMDEKKVEKRLLRDALDAILAGDKPDPAVTRHFGCGIHYE